MPFLLTELPGRVGPVGIDPLAYLHCEAGMSLTVWLFWGEKGVERVFLESLPITLGMCLAREPANLGFVSARWADLAPSPRSLCRDGETA